MKPIKLFLSTLLFYILIDIIWIGFVANQLYAKHIGTLLRDFAHLGYPHLLSALMVYALLAAGIVIFALYRAQQSYALALFYGAIFGAITYGVYDFTNYATLDDWPFVICLIDITWGAIICGITTQFGLYVKNRLN